MIRERTQAGLTAARAQGRLGGRRPKLPSLQREKMLAMIMAGRKTAAEAARLFGVHPSTVSHLVAAARQQRP